MHAAFGRARAGRWRARAIQALSTRTSTAQAPDAAALLRGGGGLLPTIWCKNKLACWVAPEGGPGAARGVVLLLIGFTQGPEGYFQMMSEVAARSRALVLMPVPKFEPTFRAQQEVFCEDLAFWLDLVASNALPGLELPEGATARRGFLGHSLGGGLGPRVACRAAQQGRPFSAAMVMAPQTGLIDASAGLGPAAAAAAWPLAGPPTVWGLQYGLKDELAPPSEPLGLLLELLKAQQRGAALRVDLDSVTQFPRGTHTGFEDQIVVADAPLVPDVLPFVDAGLLAALRWLAGGAVLPLYLAYRLVVRLLGSGAGGGGGGGEGGGRGDGGGGGRECGGRESGGREGGAELESLAEAELGLLRRWRAVYAERFEALSQSRPDGAGEPLRVDLPSPGQSAAGYSKLLAAVGLLGLVALLPPFRDAAAEGRLAGGYVPLGPSLGLGLLAVVEVQGLVELRLLDYVEKVQRPGARAAAADFFEKFL